MVRSGSARSSRGAQARLWPLVLPLLAAACGLPKDPEGTTERVLASHVIRVGVSDNPPWVRTVGGEPQGIEPALIRAFARQLGARVEWIHGGEGPLLERLEARDIDLVASGLTSASPWTSRIGTSRSYADEPGKGPFGLGGRSHLIATAPGENQLLLRLDRFIVGAKPDLTRILASDRPL